MSANKLAAALVLAATLAMPAAALAGGRSAATISGSFADSCRDFTAHSSKDISNVVILYVDGRAVKDETVNRPDYALDGSPGDEIASASVKSGTTTEGFTCTASTSPPTALLEIKTPDGPTDCHLFFESGLYCDQTVQRTVWKSSSDFPTDPGLAGSEEAGHLLWGCPLGAPGWASGACSMTFDLRGAGSSDPDGDIASWALDFDDGKPPATGSGAPPADVAHTYPFDSSGNIGCGSTLASHCVITLTVTDSAGHSDSDAITMGFIDESPD